MRRFSIRSFFLYLTLASGISYGQSGNIKGVILDFETGKPVENVHVELQATNLADVTNVGGEFSILDVPVGRFTITFSLVGYQQQNRSVTVVPNETSHITVQLKKETVELSEIDIYPGQILGEGLGLLRIPGSAHLITNDRLVIQNALDIHNVLRQVPGVHVQDEDGFGLRPNIGLRGTGVERSSKITIMEDGVLAAPAPYSSPAAYYFPAVSRMEAIEVWKGASQIQYGPFTTGGSINLVSEKIPEQFGGKIKLTGGSFGTRRVQATVGDRRGAFAYMLSGALNSSDGFKDLDTGEDTGFDLSDYLGKLSYTISSVGDVHHSIRLKFGQHTEISNETYLGLSESDFSETPFRRYAASANDNMRLNQSQLNLSYFIQIPKRLSFATTIYQQRVMRNWFKLDQIVQDGEPISLGLVLDQPENYPVQYALIRGDANSDEGTLEYKANNRSYYSRGIETRLKWKIPTAHMPSVVHAGIRFHQDGMDRLQWTEKFRMFDGNLFRTSKNEPGSDSNRIDEASAFAAFIQFESSVKGITFSPGIRMESIAFRRTNFAKDDPQRIGPNLSVIKNKVSAFMPGIGVHVAVGNDWNVYTGLHKGFAPPGFQENAQPEDSWNFEIGSRGKFATVNVDGTFFFTDYRNLLGIDLQAGGGTGTGETLNGGSAETLGAELSLVKTFKTRFFGSVFLPVRFNYTYSKTVFQSAFESAFEPWGTVQRGDRLPYVPDHQIALSAGIEREKLSLEFETIYVGMMRTRAGSGVPDVKDRIAPHTVSNLSLLYSLAKQTGLFFQAKNVFDSVYAVARRPIGLRPGIPRMFQMGIRSTF